MPSSCHVGPAAALRQQHHQRLARSGHQQVVLTVIGHGGVVRPALLIGKTGPGADGALPVQQLTHLHQRDDLLAAEVRRVQNAQHVLTVLSGGQQHL